MTHCRLVDDRHAERLRLGELAARVGAGDDVIGLLRHAARHLAARGFEQRLRLVARQRRQRAGQHERASGQRTRRRAPRRALAASARRRLRNCVDHLAIVRLGEEIANRFGEHRADVAHLEQLRLGRRHQRIERAEMRGQVARRRFADVADAERVDEARQRRRAARVDRRDDVGRALVAPCARARRARDAAACRCRPACARSSLSTSWSTSFSPRPSMSIAWRLAKCSSACLRCAGQTRPPVQRAIASSGSRTIAEPHSGHCVGMTNSRASAGRRSASTRTTSGITSPARRTIDGVADAHVLAPDLVLVVQRRVGHRDAADEHRLEPRDRRDRAGAADLHADVEELASSFPRPGTCARPPSAARASRSRARAAARGG